MGKLNVTIDLTKHNFGRIDFTEARIIDFFCSYNLPSSLEFKVWGATLLLEPRWNHVEKLDSSLPTDTDMYVAGNGTLRIDHLVGGTMEVYVYDHIKKPGQTDTAKNCDGSELRLRREWPFEKTDRLDEYLWECVIQWPYGFCILNLFSEDGKVTFQFDTEDMVPANDYIMNPKLYGFNDKNIKGYSKGSINPLKRLWGIFRGKSNK
ncbi:hypothetical protein PaecuDRAFT_4469 [Paenibacillus curdlanolyticus YK9]|uniref:Uncharacterized protein n=1 Tax=Paenibacillus curdlanolyticus YK9 TaxID=717606 RepID=E0IFK9_9BACL|nr:hypothetical protein [Paenibacillus curdlanolyticus]EFM08675.1 hypothetical protein PaecuDRAFT_4469 [Paenibacillus curdlanolyticus YK9]